MKKSIATRRLEHLTVADRLVFLVPIAIFLYMSFGNPMGLTLWATAAGAPSAAVIGSVVFLMAAFSLFLTIPVVVLWRAVTHSMRRTAIERTTFRAIEDFDYYREKLTGVSPAAISLMMDLELEPKKDIAGLLLKYTSMGVVSLEGDAVRVLDPDNPALRPSDHALLEQLARGDGRPPELSAWQCLAEKETVDAGLLRWRTRREAGAHKNRGCLTGCLLPILLFFVSGALCYFFSASGALDGVGAFLDTAPAGENPAEVAAFFLSSPALVTQCALMVLCLLPLLVCVWLPLSTILSSVLFATGNSPFRRTDRGDLLTAQISGIKNFIRDFSNLSMAEKEQLILWDDFLVYAVVLEENTRIVEDIFKMKNLNYRDFLRF